MADIKQIKIGETTYDINAKTADAATKATQDGNGHNIVNTYATKSALEDYLPLSGGTISGEIITGNIFPLYGVNCNLGSDSEMWNEIHARTIYCERLGTTTVGSSTEPIYIKDGVPTKCTITTIAVFG